MEPKNCMTCVYSGCDGLTVCKDCNDFSQHEYKPVCYEREIQSLQEELESEKNTSQVWFDRYHDVHKLTGLTPHIHAVPEYIQTLQKELETSKKLYAKKCDQHMEAEQELEEVKAKIKRTLEYARWCGGPPYWKIKELLKEGE